MPRKYSRLVIALFIVALLSLGGFAYFKTKPQTATTYEDAAGWIYSCSQPVVVKEQGARYASGKPSPTPIDETEAAKYCHRVGIE